MSEAIDRLASAVPNGALMAATDPAALLDAAVAMIEGARREGVEAMRREAIECCLAEYCDDGTAQKIEAAIVAVQVEKERTQ